jgi:serine/threonine protein kinase/Flp pilus assembly protein TadD
MSQVESDCNLLFGVLALQQELIDAQQFADACAAWSVRKDLPLAQILCDRGWLTAEDRAEVERFLQRKLKKFGGDARRTLDSVADAATRQTLGQVDDPEVRRSLRTMAAVHPPELLQTLAPAGENRARYTLSRLHGEGGLGKVWVARDNDLNREVALKEIQAGRAIQAQTLRRFLKEAQITGQLEHPNIVPVYELARRAEDDQPYYTMRLIRGRTLHQAIADFHARRAAGKADPLEWPRLLHAFVGVCQAIAYAHSRRVIHRDLKPENVVLGAFGEVIVLDWGLAKMVDSPDAEEDDLPDVTLTGEAKADSTQAGQRLGTPSYMAPEQADGRTDLVDPLTDIYGLGTILFEILTGRAPHTGGTLIELLDRIVHSETPKARTVEPSVPGPLEAICARAMARTRSERYRSAQELADEVQRWLADEKVEAYRENARERIARWTKRHRAWTQAAAVLLVAIATISTVSYLGVRQARQKEAAARRLVDEQNSKEEKRLQAVQAVVQDDVVAGQAALSAQQWEQAEERLGGALRLIHNDPQLAALGAAPERLYDQARKARSERNADREARDRFARFRRFYDDALFHGTFLSGVDLLFDHDSARTAATAALDLMGVPREPGGTFKPDPHYSDDQNRHLVEECQQLMLILADIESRALPGRPPGDPRARADLALKYLDIAAALGPTGRAYWLRRSEYLRRRGDSEAAARARSEAERVQPSGATDYFLLGDAMYRAGDLKGALGAFRESLGKAPDNFWAHYFSAVCRLNLERPGEAETSLTACLAIRTDFPWVYLLRGYSRGLLGEMAGSESDFARALDLARTSGGDRVRYAVFVNQGRVRVLRGQLPQGIADLERAVALKPDQSQGHANLSFGYEKRGDLNKAIAHLDRAIALAPSAGLYLRRARIRLERGDPAAASDDFDRALRLERPDSALAARVRAEQHLAAGHFAEAIREFDRALEAGSSDADLFRARGLARANLGDNPGAVEDYNRSLALDPGASNIRTRRGWTYVLNPDQLALAEFERAIKLNSRNGDAHNGRGFVLARLGRYREAIEDAEKALVLGPPVAEMIYNAACIFAQASGKARSDANVNAANHRELSTRYAARAVDLIRQSLGKLPAGRRAEFWRQSIASDPALDPIRDTPVFVQLNGEFAATGK